MQIITDALNARKPELIKWYTEMVTGQFNRLVEAFGENIGQSGIYNHRFGHVWRETVRPCTVQVNLDGSPVATRGYNPNKTKPVIDAAKLAHRAKEYANVAVAEWLAKIIEKMGDVDSAQVEAYGHYGFKITGTKAGHQVYIVQEMILNVSIKGKLFNQFPARIYVDGKFISAAKFKKL